MQAAETSAAAAQAQRFAELLRPCNLNRLSSLRLTHNSRHLNHNSRGSNSSSWRQWPGVPVLDSLA